MRTINVYNSPSSTRELDNGSFFCTHDEVEIEDAVENNIGPQGPHQTESKIYVCADPDCSEQLEGDPAQDSYESMIA